MYGLESPGHGMLGLTPQLSMLSPAVQGGGSAHVSEYTAAEKGSKKRKRAPASKKKNGGRKKKLAKNTKRDEEIDEEEKRAKRLELNR